MNDDSLNKFDFIAPYYDRLARIVFGRAIVNAQVKYFNLIKDHSEILIIGGGTGWIATELLQKGSHCNITYVEASKRMLSIARKRNLHNTRINFVHGTEEAIISDKKFDVIIANFFFDIFSIEQLKSVVSKLQSHLHHDGIWLITDFATPRKLWQKGMLFIMYRFFHAVSNLNNRSLPDWQLELKVKGLFEIESAEFYGRFIKSSVYRLASE